MKKAVSRLESDKITWNLTLITLLFAALLPEYIAPFFTLVNFLIFKRHFKVTGQKVKMGNLGKAMMIFCCYMMATCIWSLTKVHSVLIALLWMGMLLGEMFIANLITSKERLQKALFFFSISAAIVSVIACLQMIFYRFGVYFPNPFWRDIDYFVFTRLPFTIETRFVTGRASGTFDNPQVLAPFLLLVFPIQIYCISQETNKKRLTVNVLCMLITFAGLLVTYSRSAYLAIVAIFIVLAFLGWKYTAIFGASGLIAVSLLPKSVLSRIDSLFALDISTITRLDIWINLLGSFGEHPVLGYGAGTESVTMLLHEKYKIMQPHAHNLYLEILIEGGIIGLLFFGAFLGVLIYDLVYLMRGGRYWLKLGIAYLACLVGFLVFSIFDFALSTPKEIQFFMLYLGFVEATRRLCKKEKESKTAEEAKKKEEVVITE